MRNKISEIINEARKSGDSIKKEAFQAVLSSIQLTENKQNKTLSDDEVLTVVEKEKNIFLESSELFKEKNVEFSQQEALRAEKLSEILPEKMTEDATKAEISKIILNLNAETIKDMGRVMKEIRGKFGKSIDMEFASKFVKEVLQ